MNGRHVTAHFAGWYVAYHGGTHLSVNLIRQWTHRGHVNRVGTDDDGYALYDLSQICAHARLRGYLDN